MFPARKPLRKPSTVATRGNSLDAKAAAQEVLDKVWTRSGPDCPCCDGTGQGMGSPVLPREQSVGTDGAHAGGQRGWKPALPLG